MALVLAEILEVRVERRPGRRYPRAVKRPKSPFPCKTTAPRPPPAIAPDAPVRIVPPAHAGLEETEKPVPQPACGAGERFWWEQVRAWKRSDLSKAEYAQKHDLPLRAFKLWITRLSHRLRRPEKCS